MKLDILNSSSAVASSGAWEARSTAVTRGLTTSHRVFRFAFSHLTSRLVEQL